jgi:hypothetical protein
MNKLRKIVDYALHSPDKLLLVILVRMAPIIPDKLYLKWLFRLKMGYKLNLDNPKTFNEKLQWLKLYNRKPEYTQMVDKFAVKEYVAKIIGEEYIIPTIGVWDKFEDIDFEALPNQFVLKTTHGGGGGGVVICKDKSKFDIQAAKIKLNKSLKQCIYKSLKEWPYKDVPRRIIAERYMVDKVSENNPYGNLVDYKFYCFDGCVKVCMIATERYSETGVCFDYFDSEFNHYPFEQGGPNSKKNIKKPELLDDMITLATKLSAGMPHVRVDLYCVDKQIYFGELTLFDSSGFAEFNPIEWDYTFGNWIELPKQYIQ